MAMPVHAVPLTAEASERSSSVAMNISSSLPRAGMQIINKITS